MYCAEMKPDECFYLKDIQAQEL